MSTILKALKKLEADQRAAAPVNLAGKIVTADHGKSRGRDRSAVLIAAGVSAGLLLALVLLGAWLWWQPAPPVDLAQNAMAPAEKPALTAAPTAEPTAATAVSNQPAVTAPPPAVSALAAPRPVPLTQASAAIPRPTAALPSATSQARVSPVAAAVTAPRETSPQQVIVTDRQIPPPGQQWAAPQLEVTDIFPPTAGQSRMAVVNGLPVMAGMKVEDALVEEIRADRVLFTIDGKTVAVPLNPGR